MILLHISLQTSKSQYFQANVSIFVNFEVERSNIVLCKRWSVSSWECLGLTLVASITMAASFNSPVFSRAIATIAGAFQNTPGGKQPNSQPLEQIHSLHLQQEELLYYILKSEYWFTTCGGHVGYTAHWWLGAAHWWLGLGLLSCWIHASPKP